MAALTKQLVVGNPTRRDVYVGPMIREHAYRAFEDYCEALSHAGRMLVGGHTLHDGDRADGFYCAPTVVADVPLDHPLWTKELFVPLVMLGQVGSLDKAMALTNETQYGLTGGFYGTAAEAQWYFDRVQAGTVYANRPQGASTGAWPGYQSFGGWKGSTSVGRGTGGPYYLLSYMREQSQTIVEAAPAAE